MIIPSNYIEIFCSVSHNKMLRVTWLVFLFVMFVTGIVVVLWLSASVDNSEINNALNEAVEKNNKLNQHILLKKHLDKTIPLVDSIESKYKTRLSQPDVMMKIGDLAHRNNLRIVSQYYSHSTNDKNITSATIVELRISGRYTDIRKMLSQLPSMPVWVEVTSVDIERQLGAAVSAQIKLVVLMEHTL